MANVSMPIKYLKDESGNKFSPVVSMDSICNSTGIRLGSAFRPQTIFTGSVNVPSVSSSTFTKITVTEDINNFECLYFVRSNVDNVGGTNLLCSNLIYPYKNGSQTLFQGFVQGASNWRTEKLMFIQMSIDRVDATHVEIGSNCLIYIKTDNAISVTQTYTAMPLNQLIGLKRI